MQVVPLSETSTMVNSPVRSGIPTDTGGIAVTISNSSILSSGNHIPTTTSSNSSSSLSVPTQSPGPTQAPRLVPHSDHRGAIIGGILGGLVLLALVLGVGFLYCRRRGARRASMLTSHPNQDHMHGMEGGSNAVSFLISSPFNRTMEKSIIGAPRPEGDRPPEGKRGKSPFFPMI